MRLTTKCHIKALRDVITLSLLGGTLACTIDTFWLLYEIKHNGFTVPRGVIGSVLSIATILTLIATVKHHKVKVREILAAIKLKRQEDVKIRKHYKEKHDRKQHH